MRRLLALGAIAVVGSFVVPTAASANDCGATVVDAGGVAYVAVDDPSNGDISVWVYQESNGTPGLQRGDDVCAGDNADTIIF